MSNKQDVFTKFGDYKLNKLDLTTHSGEVYELGNIFYELSIFESIYDPGVTGYVRILDGHNFVDKLNIKGGEKLSISFNTCGISTKIEGDFIIYKKGEVANHERKQTFTFFFMTEEMFESQRTRVSRHFEANAEDIIKQVLTDLGSRKDTDFDKSTYIRDYIAPNITPFDVIEDLTEVALSQNKLQDFLFFETNGGYYFKPVSELIAGSVEEEYTMGNPMNFDTVEDRHKFIFTNVADYKEGDTFTLLSDIDGGTFSVKTIDFDITTKKVTERVLDRNAIPTMESNKTTHTLFSMGDSDKVISNLVNKHRTPLTQPTQLPETRYMMLNGLNMHTVTLTVSGNSALEAGMCISFNLPSLQNADSKDAVDKERSGKRLITDLRHIVMPNEYTCVINAVKDSYK